MSKRRGDKTEHPEEFPAEPWKDEEYLKMAYVKRGQTIADIAAIFNLSASSIHYWLEKHSIKRRPGFVPQERVVTTDEIQRDIKRVADDLGGAPSVYKYEQLGKHSTMTVYNRFASWDEALKESLPQGVSQWWSE